MVSILETRFSSVAYVWRWYERIRHILEKQPWKWIKSYTTEFEVFKWVERRNLKWKKKEIKKEIKIEEVVDKILRIFYPTYENIPQGILTKYKIQIRAILETFIHSFIYSLLPEEKGMCFIMTQAEWDNMGVEEAIKCLQILQYSRGWNNCRRKILENLKNATY